MKQISLSLLLVFLTLTFALSQVNVTFTLSFSQTSVSIPQTGINVQYAIKLTKPSNQVTTGYVRIYAKGGAANSPIQDVGVSHYIYASLWNNNEINLSGSFLMIPSYLGNISGVIYAEYESDSGVKYKSTNIPAYVLIYNNTISPPVPSTFNNSGNPSIINGSTPGGGGAGTYTYQWQSSTASASTGFSNIASATSSTYDPPTITQTTYYRRVVRSGVLTSNSNVVTLTISAFPPISNNSISNSGSSILYGTSVDPSLLNGSTPSGGAGSGSYMYQWQSSLENSTDFINISGAINQNYDPGFINQTTNYRRIVTSGGFTSISNDITVTVRPTGSVFEYPIDIGNLVVGMTYADNRSFMGFGNEYGNSFEDVFYRFSLNNPARVIMDNCKSDGTSTLFYLLNSGGSLVQGGTTNESCDVGIQVDFSLQPGTYYIVTEPQDSWTLNANLYVYVDQIIGSTQSNPINIGNLNPGATYGDNRSPIGYGNNYGNSYEDIYYRFSLNNTSRVSIDNCKSDGSPAIFYLLDSGGNLVQGGIIIESCDVGIQVDFNLPAGTYYIVTEVQDSWTVTANFSLYVSQLTSARLSNEEPINHQATDVEDKQLKGFSEGASGIFYPNPASQQLSFTIENDSKALIQVVNMNGVIVKESSMTAESKSLDVAELPNGLYLVRIVEGRKVHNEKLLIRR